VAVPPSERGQLAGGAPRPEDLAGARDALVAWHAAYPGRRTTGLASLGIDPARKTPATVYEAAFGALLLGRGVPADVSRGLLDALRASGALLSLGKGKAPIETVGALLTRTPDPATVSAAELCVHLPRLLGAVADPGALLRVDDPRELLWGFWRRLYEPTAPLAPFLLARFLVETGQLSEPHAAAGFVPTFQVRENAFRIGFLDRLYAPSFGDLIEAGLGLGAWFPPPVFEGPLAQVHEGYGCAFRCGRTALCPLACREKGEG
jgi:hypothetical protein